MTQPRALPDALAAVAAGYAPEDRRTKVRLLEQLARSDIRDPGGLLRFHEALCFLQAYPDDPKVLDRVDHALARFRVRVEQIGGVARTRLSGSGIAGTTLEYPFGYPMARWLASRFPADVGIAWQNFDGAERLEEALGVMLAHAEADALSEGGLGWRRWLRVAKGGRRLSDLQLLIELVEGQRRSEETRDWLFESLELPIVWRLRGASRTLAKLSLRRPHFQRQAIRRGGFSFMQEVTRPLPSIRRATQPWAESLIESARAAVATRLRELHAFSYPNSDDVWVVDPGWGLRIALIGLLPRFRLPLEGYYAFYVLKNGVPVSYGGGWELFGTLELGLNIFESFRQGESAFIFSQILRAYRQILGISTLVIDPYQLGHDNLEALKSGAFYFYRRLGFRPRDPAVLRLAEREQRKIARNPAYRSPLGILKRLARSEVYLTLPGGSRTPERRLRARHVAALVTRRIARDFPGDREAAVRHAAARMAEVLEVPGWKQWPPDERWAFERLSVVAALVPNLERWPVGDHRALARILRAKGGRSEVDYTRLLRDHRRFRRSLVRLVSASLADLGEE